MTPLDILAAIYSRIHADRRFKHVYLDNDNDSGEIVFILTDGTEYILSSSAIRRMTDD